MDDLDKLIQELEDEQAAKAAAPRVRVVYIHTETDPVTAETQQWSEEFELTTLPGGTVEARSVYGGKVSESFYHTHPSAQAAEAFHRAAMHKRGADWVRGNAQIRDWEVVEARFLATVPPLLVKHGFHPDSEDAYLYRVLLQAIENERDRLDDLLAYLNAPYKTSGAFRTAVRALVSAGKAYARDQYEDTYRNEEDKDDFYEDYITDVAEGVLGEL